MNEPYSTATTSVSILPADSTPNTITFYCDQLNEVMRLDKDGMTYKGQRIEDGVEAYKAFMEVMELMKENLE